MSDHNANAENVYEYIVVGSGAGGGPVAVRLADAGARVLVLEAGTAAEDLDYQVPAFHANAAENPAYSWEFFVRHYADEQQQRRDPKYRPERGGVFYPRAATLGGCTAHNAMITVCPPNADWDAIAEVTGDESWRGEAMRTYFQQLERCRHAARPQPLPSNRLLAALLRWLPFVSARYRDAGRHGFDGWLTTTLADPKLLLADWQLVNVVVRAAEDQLAATLGRPLTAIERFASFVDPNDWEVLRGNPEGVWLVPQAVDRGRRNGTREALLAAQARNPGRLTVRTSALATRVLFDLDGRAVGVEYLDGARLYRAHPDPAPAARPEVCQATATGEVLLAGGAFNTPQLLMLSGIGPADELARFGIDVRVDLPGVGRNLQDRYEVGVVSAADDEFTLLADCRFRPPGPGEQPDRGLVEWENGRGVYTSNGVVLGIIHRSSPGLTLPDLFIFGLPASFTGYYPGYSRELERSRNLFTWAILKGHTENTAGRVRLRSADPRDVPDISFSYFEEGDDTQGRDLDAVVEGIELVRRINRRIDCLHAELVPGPQVRTRDELRGYVRDNAWGHHACGTCKIGAVSDPMAVLDSAFRVRGTAGLRVVDASVFPRIPGFFIVTSIYMAAEKAANMILADRRTPHLAQVPVQEARP